MEWVNLVFPGKPRIDKTAEEFGEALKVLFGKRAGKRTLTLEKFNDSLYNVSKLVFED